MQHRLISRLFRNSVVAAAVLVGSFAVTAAPKLQADDNDCQRRIAKADHRLHEVVEHHGSHSKQADRARRDLHEAREHCWNSGHRWWNEDDRKWHTERDWDDRDHDRDDHR